MTGRVRFPGPLDALENYQVDSFRTQVKERREGIGGDHQRPGRARASEVSGRDRILMASRKLFIERGYASVSMQEIAEEAGLRKASLYHHFRDKNRLFIQVVVDVMAEHRLDLEREISGGGPVRELLERIAVAQLKTMQSDFSRIVQDFRQHIPESEHDEIHAELWRMQALMSGVFEEAAREGNTLAVPANIAGLFFFHMVLAWIMHAPDIPELSTVDHAEAARVVTATLLDGILRKT